MDGWIVIWTQRKTRTRCWSPRRTRRASGGARSRRWPQRYRGRWPPCPCSDARLYVLYSAFVGPERGQSVITSLDRAIDRQSAITSTMQSTQRTVLVEDARHGEVPVLDGVEERGDAPTVRSARVTLVHGQEQVLHHLVVPLAGAEVQRRAPVVVTWQRGCSLRG